MGNARASIVDLLQWSSAFLYPVGKLLTMLIGFLFSPLVSLPFSKNRGYSDKIININIMIVLGIILIFLGGYIFAVGERNEGCLTMIIGAIINFAGFGLIISAF